MVQTLLTGWNLMRWLRLGLGVYGAVQAVQLQDVLTGGIAALFLFQVITNTGCCSANGCTTSFTNNEDDKVKEVTFEEVKSK